MSWECVSSSSVYWKSFCGIFFFNSFIEFARGGIFTRDFLVGRFLPPLKFSVFNRYRDIQGYLSLWVNLVIFTPQVICWFNLSVEFIANSLLIIFMLSPTFLNIWSLFLMTILMSLYTNFITLTIYIQYIHIYGHEVYFYWLAFSLIMSFIFLVICMSSNRFWLPDIVKFMLFDTGLCYLFIFFVMFL